MPTPAPRASDDTAEPRVLARGDAVVAARATTELAEVLVRLLERECPAPGEQSGVRRLVARALGRALGMGEAERDALALAALLGSLGELREPGATGGKQLGITLQLLSAARLPGAARDALAYQHERWDGGGFPRGLRGEQIPLAARILAVARAAAALLPTRGPVRAVGELRRQAGSAFDPRVVGALGSVFAQLLRGAAQHSDESGARREMDSRAEP